MCFCLWLLYVPCFHLFYFCVFGSRFCVFSFPFMFNQLLSLHVCSLVVFPYVLSLCYCLSLCFFVMLLLLFLCLILFLSLRFYLSLYRSLVDFSRFCFYRVPLAMPSQSRISVEFLAPDLHGHRWAHMGPIWVPYGLIWEPYGSHLGPCGAHMAPYRAHMG